MKSRNTKSAALPLWATDARISPNLAARAQILEAAAHAFMRGGYAGTTLDDVARVNAVTKGQIYHYYRSKMDLYFDVVVGAHFMVNERVLPIAGESGLPADQRMQRIAHAHAAAVTSTFPFHKVAMDATQERLLMDSSLREHPAMAHMLDLRRQYQDMIERTIADGVRERVFDIPSVLLATRAVLGALNWLTVWYDPARSPTAAERDALASGIADFVLSGLRRSDLPFDEFAARARGEAS